MQVTVRYLGILREFAGCETESQEVREGCTLQDLYASLQRRIPQLTEFHRAIAVAVNYEYSGPERVLHEGDEVALLPPVSGGAQKGSVGSGVRLMQATDHAALVRQPIDGTAIAATIKQPDDGALVVFDGVVRNQTRGRRTLYLEYTAYEPMALEQMERLAVQARADFAVRDVWLVHRLGRLEIGETSVYIAVASGHRAAAFEACRWAIDTLKRTVPIWKKEFFEDGAVWADGEPFPPEVPVADGGASKSGRSG
jgi:MoaE-MoaD fusion protein